MSTAPQSQNNHASFIWQVADLLRGDYKQSQYQQVILPLVVIRRLNCVMEEKKAEVVADAEQLPEGLDDPDFLLETKYGPAFNSAKLTFPQLLDDPGNIAANLRTYIAGFSEPVRDTLERFDFDRQIDKLDRSNLLFQVVGKFCEIDLHPDRVSNIEMGLIYEELIRRFSEMSNETAGEHFTPRDVIRLMVDILFAEDRDELSSGAKIKSIYDPACGTGGMLTVAKDKLRELNPDATLEAYGQELNPETYAVARSDALMRGDGQARNIAFGNSFSQDHHPDRTFDYLLANPPFGVEWKKVAKEIEDEHETLGYDGRFGAGLPRKNDGSLLFLQHMISKMRPPEEGGSRLAIVFNGSPLFTGATGGGESEIRRWIIENDWLEAVVALPDQLFYNTGISTYFWVVTNRKSPEREGKVQLVDARASFSKMRKSLGEKRKEIPDEQAAEILSLYAGFEEGERVKIFPNESFGFMRITVERPLRLRWEVSEETLAAVEAEKKLAKLDETDREALVAALRGHLGVSSLDGGAFAAEIASALDVVELTAAQRKALLSALSVQDPEAPVVVDNKGRPKPDSDLRDQENVALLYGRLCHERNADERWERPEFREAVDAYMADEVLPHVDDAWVDHSKTKIGYEIPLTRHFYEYQPSRTIEEIDSEISRLEVEITELMSGQIS